MCIEHQHIRIISEGSCDTKAKSNGSWKFNIAFTEINYILKYIRLQQKIVNISQSYCSYCISDKRNAPLNSIRDFFQNIIIPNIWILVYIFFSLIPNQLCEDLQSPILAVADMSSYRNEWSNQPHLASPGKNYLDWEDSFDKLQQWYFCSLGLCLNNKSPVVRLTQAHKRGWGYPWCCNKLK